jgi:NADH dehydrogenase [ubiquinone] 1 alpha subcomplex assembly factor 7
VTAFERMIRDVIAHEGPISVERYMSLCLRHYYATRDPLGAAGDFITAPEISQMFGELIGLWAVEVWVAMARPRPFRLVELGPGRGTLMADALRAAGLMPDFLAAAAVDLVESSPTLRRSQERSLEATGVRLAWHDRLEDVPPGPTILIANEFLDALPIRQFVATEHGWRERLVGLRDDRLLFGLSAESERDLPPPGRPGDVLEWPRAAMALAEAIGHRLAAGRGAALLIDYGYWGPAFGDTLQALRSQRFADPLVGPGEADLTAHVDFHRIAEAAGDRVRVHGPVPQSDFLEALGIRERAAALSRRATPAQAEDVGRTLDHLTARGPAAMGELFKVLGLSHRDLETLPGLPSGPRAKEPT